VFGRTSFHHVCGIDGVIACTVKENANRQRHFALFFCFPVQAQVQSDLSCGQIARAALAHYLLRLFHMYR
jgi:hypothetical protein